MKNKIVLITGSTDGIGKQTALELAKRGAYVILHGRSELKAKQTLEEIQEKTGSRNLEYLCCDLASLKSVREFAEEFKKRHDRLHVLINNAGVYMRAHGL